MSETSERDLRRLEREAGNLRIAYPSLTERDAYIIAARDGRFGLVKLSYTEIGARFGVTGERIRQLEKRAATLVADDVAHAQRVLAEHGIDPA